MVIKKNKFAFTLVEMLVVIAVIGVLTTLAMVAVQSSRENTRNAKRVADIKQIQNALELYYQDNNAYPLILNSGEALVSGTVTYMEQIPFVPTPNDGACSEEENYYIYTIPTRFRYFYYDVENNKTKWYWEKDDNYYDVHFCIGENSGSLSAGEVVASSRGLNNWTCSDRLLDYRDGQSYATVQIGNQCWMAENLNYDRNCSSTTWTNGTDVGWCGYHSNNTYMINYNFNNIFGREYQWSAAMNNETEEGARGICPEGWHIPTSEEWVEATTTINNNIDYRCNGIEGNIAKAFSSTMGWRPTTTDDCFPVGPNQIANNITGFNAYPFGYRGYTNGTFYSLTWGAYFWTSTLEWSETSQIYNPLYVSMIYTRAYISSKTTNRANAFYIRCIKNQ